MDEDNDGLTTGLDPGLGPMALGDDDDTLAIDEFLQTAVVLACHVVGSADIASITMGDNGSYRTSNATGDDAVIIDQAQYDGNDGPCLQALRSGRQVHVAVGADATRWPRFDDEASDRGISAVLSTPLSRPPEAVLGALNLYSRRPGGFTETDVQAAERMADHATVLVANAIALAGASRLNVQLRQAVASREIIGEAKGIIMERESCTRDAAFEVLRRASQRENRKLRDIAEDLVLRVEARRRAPRPEL